MQLGRRRRRRYRLPRFNVDLLKLVRFVIVFGRHRIFIEKVDETFDDLASSFIFNSSFRASSLPLSESRGGGVDVGGVGGVGRRGWW